MEDNGQIGEGEVEQSSSENALSTVQAAGTSPENQQDKSKQQEAQHGFFSAIKSFLIRAVIMYFIFSLFRRPQQPTKLPDGGKDAEIIGPASNIFEDSTFMDLYVYLSEKEFFNEFHRSDSLVWHQSDLQYGDWFSGPTGDGSFQKYINFEASENIKKNGSLYLHVYITKSDFAPSPLVKGAFDENLVIYASQRLNKYKRKKYRKTSNLITGETVLTEEEIKKAESEEEEIISHWHPNVTINIIHDHTQWVRGSVPPPIDEYVQFTLRGNRYKPILYVNTYWNLYKDYQPINESTTQMDLNMNFLPITLFKWQMYAAQNVRNKWPGGSMLSGLTGDQSEEEQDALKEAFLETSPYLLGLTILVSILHLVFEFLAFKNDIQFWKDRKSLEGLSVRSVFFNVFQSLIVLLYVLDHETNFVIKMSCFVGLVIELWKITKVMDVSVNREFCILGIPTLKLQDKGTYVQSNTKEYDEIAFKYLGVVLFPLFGGYCVYSLFFQEHKGWYSFVLSMFYGFLLTFGFIMMTPQLFINYKLKSVAHLPWRMLTYKALNTFIDDIFAFVIKMPTMYRLGCLRDDVIFFIFLYQRYIYHVDPTRINEFGFSQEMETSAKAAKDHATKENHEKKD